MINERIGVRITFMYFGNYFFLYYCIVCIYNLSNDSLNVTCIYYLVMVLILKQDFSFLMRK